MADPIFLLKRERWEKILEEDAKPVPEHYIFAYNTYPDPTYEAALKKLAGQTSLPVIRATWKLKNALAQRMLFVQTPERWLKLLANADYVVTNSFHGTGFSILFHRKFFSIVPGSAEQGSNVRLWELLGRLGLEDRITSSAPGVMDTGEVDYSRADLLLEDLRKESADFLRKNLEAAKELRDA